MTKIKENSAAALMNKFFHKKGDKSDLKGDITSF